MRARWTMALLAAVTIAGAGLRPASAAMEAAKAPTATRHTPAPKSAASATTHAGPPRSAAKAPPERTPPASPSPTRLAGAETLDFSGWQRLLDEYIVVQSAPGEPLDTRFDYVRLFLNPGKAERLTEVREQLLAAIPSTLGVDARHAWAINTYNFLVVERVIENLVSRQVPLSMKARGITAYPRHMVQDIKIDGVEFFEAPIATIEGKTYSPEQFERTFVFDGYALPQPGKRVAVPPATIDPRAHFAIVGASLGSPTLQPRAFRAESLDVQLDDAVRLALESPHHLRFDPALGQVWGSSIFSWYEADFGGKDGVAAFVRGHAPAAMRAALEAKPAPLIDGTIPWDWNFNIVPKKTAKPPAKTPKTGAPLPGGTSITP